MKSNIEGASGRSSTLKSNNINFVTLAAVLEEYKYIYISTFSLTLKINFSTGNAIAL